MNIYFAMIGSLMLAFAGGYCACELIHRLRKPEVASPEANHVTVYYKDSELVDQKEVAEEFAVTGKSKKRPFRERKKELKAGARTKRRKLEEWRD